MNSQDNVMPGEIHETPIHDELAGGTLEVTVRDPFNLEANLPQWPNQQPVVDGVDEVSQDPDFVTDDVEEDQ